MNIMIVDNSKIVRNRISTLVDALPNAHVNSFDKSTEFGKILDVCGRKENMV